MESLTFPDGALSPVLPTTECAKNYSDEHLRFLQAIDRYKRCNRRPFPTWFEVFEVFRSLGYRLTEARDGVSQGRDGASEKTSPRTFMPELKPKARMQLEAYQGGGIGTRPRKQYPTPIDRPGQLPQNFSQLSNADQWEAVRKLEREQLDAVGPKRDNMPASRWLRHKVGIEDNPYTEANPYYYGPDDVGNIATKEAVPAKVRGVLDNEPFHIPGLYGNTANSRDLPPASIARLRVTEVWDGQRWRPVTGNVRLQGPVMTGLHSGDEIEVTGRFGQIPPPSEAGDFDNASYWQLHHRAKAQIVVKPHPDAIQLVSPAPLATDMEGTAARGQQALEQGIINNLPPDRNRPKQILGISSNVVATDLIVPAAALLPGGKWREARQAGAAARELKAAERALQKINANVYVTPGYLEKMLEPVAKVRPRSVLPSTLGDAALMEQDVATERAIRSMQADAARQQAKRDALLPALLSDPRNLTEMVGLPPIVLQPFKKSPQQYASQEPDPDAMKDPLPRPGPQLRHRGRATPAHGYWRHPGPQDH
jgi:hypothetical protein